MAVNSNSTTSNNGNRMWPAIPSGTSRRMMAVSQIHSFEIFHFNKQWLISDHFVVSAAHCTNYLCPGTLACVHFPHHCPCAFPAVEDKVELADGSAVCLSKGGFQQGEVARKVELARMGKL